MGNDVTIGDVYEAIGAHATGRMSDEDFAELEAVASPGAGACGGQFTANTMAMAFEVLGISPMAQNLVPAQDPTQGRGGLRGRQAGGRRPQARPAARARSSPRRRSRTPSPASPARAARPTPSCTCSRSRARSASSSTSTTSTASASARRCCATSSPAASTSPSTSTRRAACPVMLQRLQEAGLLNEEHDHRHRADDRRARRGGHRDRGPARRARPRRAAEGHRRPGHPARQPRARGLRHQARRPREAPPRGPRARLRRRGGGLRRGHQRRASRPATSSSSATRARPADRACARCSP